MVIEKEILVNKSIKDAWKVLGVDFANASKWASAVNHSEAIGNKFNGSTCSERGCSTTMGSIKEKLYEFSEENYSLAYEVVGGMPSMVKYATNTWKLVDVGKGYMQTSNQNEYKNGWIIITAKNENTNV